MGHAARMGRCEMHKMLVRKPEGKRHVGGLRRRWGKLDLK
jgi:hypothetical protein